MAKKFKSLEGVELSTLLGLTSNDMACMSSEDVVIAIATTTQAIKKIETDIDVATLNSGVSVLTSQLNSAKELLETLKGFLPVDDSIAGEQMFLELETAEISENPEGESFIDGYTQYVEVLEAKPNCEYHLAEGVTALAVYLVLQNTEDFQESGLIKITSKNNKSVIAFVEPTAKLLADGITYSSLNYLLDEGLVVKDEEVTYSLSQKKATAKQLRTFNTLD